MSTATLDLGHRPLSLTLPPVEEARPWRDVTVVFAVLFVITLGAWSLDERELNGISVWIKPLKFQLSLALHFATLALLARLAPEPFRRGRIFGWIVISSVAAGLFEIFYIMLQAGRGRTSHFNDETAVEVVMYALMGIGSLVLVAAPLIMGAALLRHPGARVRREPMRLGAGLGLVLSALATVIVAGYLSTHGGHWVGGVPSDAGGLPVFGWSQQGGDLRVAHFFATHAMQVLPLVGYALRNHGPRGARLVAAAGGLYAALTAATFVQALLGQPFIALTNP